MSDKKWKSSLVSSSLPLEHEVARILVAKGFSVEADYTYARDDAGRLKDFPVDINATGYSPFNDPNQVDGMLELLVECKGCDRAGARDYAAFLGFFFLEPS